MGRLFGIFDINMQIWILKTLERCAKCSQILKYNDSALSGHGRVIPIGAAARYLLGIRRLIGNVVSGKSGIAQN